jgi:hypothetical protein
MVLSLGGQKFRDRPAVTDKVHEQSIADIALESFCVQKLANIEQVSRMLPIKRRRHLAAEELGMRHDRQLSANIDSSAINGRSSSMSRTCSR